VTAAGNPKPAAGADQAATLTLLQEDRQADRFLALVFAPDRKLWRGHLQGDARVEVDRCSVKLPVLRT
jgi:hypothetical protein